MVAYKHKGGTFVDGLGGLVLLVLGARSLPQVIDDGLAQVDTTKVDVEVL